jgi:hypothetical protein
VRSPMIYDDYFNEAYPVCYRQEARSGCTFANIVFNTVCREFFFCKRGLAKRNKRAHFTA